VNTGLGLNSRIGNGNYVTNDNDPEADEVGLKSILEVFRSKHMAQELPSAIFTTKQDVESDWDCTVAA
jgi:hypothetical protein